MAQATSARPPGRRASTAARSVALSAGPGLVGFLSLDALVATDIAALALVLPVWAAALIITAVRSVVAAVMATSAKKQVDQAARPTPSRR